MKKCNCIHRYLSASFRTLGRNLAQHPLLFCFIPLLCTSILSLGFFRVKMTIDLEYLLSPINGRARKEMDAVESLFPPGNDKNFLTETRLKPFFIVIVEPKHDRTALREDIISYLEIIDNAVKNITISYKNKSIRYQDVCLITATGGCFVNDVLLLKGKIQDIERKRLLIRYPVDDRIISSYRFSAVNMGGVTVNKDGYVENVKAFRLLYYLKYSTPKMDEILELWTKECKKVMTYLQSDYLNIAYFSKSILNNDMAKITENSFSLIFVIAPLMIIFAFLTCLTKDWVTSKPWIAVTGCLSPIFGVIGAFGLLLLCGAEYVDLNITLLFLLAGVGLDDSFVLLAAWRRTEPDKPVEDRMSETYSEAAVSITITSLTNVLCFFIGLTTSYNIIRIFSMYGALSLLFGYIYQLTFFGGTLALTGYLEKNNRHSLLCVQIKPDNFKECNIIRLLYYGWPAEKHDNVKKNSVSFYRDKLATALNKSFVKFVTIVVFVLYLAGGIYSLRYVDPNLKIENSFPHDSNARNAIVKHYEYFTQYPHPIIIVINGTLDYSQPQVQKEVQNILSKFATAPNMAGNELTFSWLKTYLESVKDKRFSLSYRGYNISNREDFTYALQSIFLRMTPFRSFKQDIILNENKTAIIASRYVVSSKDILNSEMEKQMLLMLWDIADSCKYQVYVHNYWFIFYNHLISIISYSIQSLCIAVVAVMSVVIIFIPNVQCAVFVALTIVSVQIGVIGYMSLWSVSFDTTAMFILVMSAGLSVDYVTHISYAYVSSTYTNPDEKLKYALHAVGHPVVQGCLSTFLGVVLTVFIPLSSIVVFFKIITLAIFFSGVHALFFLPVALNVSDKIWRNIRNKSSSDERTITSRVSGTISAD